MVVTLVLAAVLTSRALLIRLPLDAYAMNAAGTVVVGSADSGGRDRACKWTREGQLVFLGAGDTKGESMATGVSDSGDVVVGTLQTESARSVIVWRSSRPAQAVAKTWQKPRVSGDGTVVIGSTSEFAPFKWTEWGGLEILPIVEAFPRTPASATGVSSDGAVIVGGVCVSKVSEEARKRATPLNGGFDMSTALSFWSGSKNLKVVPNPSQFLSTLVTGCNADATVVCGYGVAERGWVPFTWAAATGFRFLPTAGYIHARALGVASKTDVAYGVGFKANSAPPVVWIRGGEPVELDQLVRSLGVQGAAGWTFEEIRGISADGRVMIGSGKGPDGRPGSWLLQLDRDL